MKTQSPSLLLAALAAFGSCSYTASAADRIKQNNTTALNLAGSWDTLPGSGDVAVWDSTVTGANTVALGADLSWAGIKIVNPGGDVIITHTVGQTLTLGSSGIDMSAATKNLTLLNTTNVAGNVSIGANQTWNVASGRSLVLFSNSNSANQRLTGSGNIEITGGGSVRLLTGDAGSTTFTAGNGNDTFTGNWKITSGSVRGLRNGTHAWGQGTITLNGGTIGQEQGSWTWANNITLATSTTSAFDDFNGSGTTRSLKLQGIISGDGNLTFKDTFSRMNNENGYILTGANTMSGTVTLDAGAEVRVGGVGGNDTTTVVGSTGTLGTATIVNNGTLILSRNNTWTFANNMSGSGLLRVGLTSGSATHIVTVSGNNSHSGGTTLQSAVTLKIGSSNALGTGTFTIAGNGIFDNSTGAPLTVANALTLSGGSPTFTGTHDMTINGAVAISTSNRTITVDANTLTLGGNISEDVAGRGLTKAGAGTLVLSGTNGHTGATTLTGGTLSVGTSGNLGGAAATLVFNGGALRITGTALSNFSGIGHTVTFTSGKAVVLDINDSGHVFTADQVLSQTSGGFTKRGAGTVVLNQSNTYTGPTRVSAGTLALANGATIHDASSVTIDDVAGATLRLDNSETIGSLEGGGTTGGALNLQGNTLTTGDTTASVNFSGTISGAGGALVKQGTGIQVLGGNNSYTGGSTVNAGQLTLNHSNAAGTGSVTLNGSEAQLQLGDNVTIANALIVADTAGDTAAKSLRHFAAASIYSGTITINEATAGYFTVNVGVASGGLTISGNIDGTGAAGLTKQGSGALTLSGANTYSGDTTISSGVLQVGSSGALGTIGTISMNGGTLQFSAANTTDYSSRLRIEDAKTATFDTNGQNVTFANALATGVAATGSLAKSGTGTLTLSASTAYSGVTTVSAGTLAVTTSTALGRGIENSSGQTTAIVDFGANTLTLGNATAGNTGHFYYGVLSGTGTVALRGGSFSIANTNGTAGTSGNFQILSPITAAMPTSAFALDTGASVTNRKDFGFLNDTNDVLTLSSLAGYGAIRGDGGGTAGSTVTRYITVDQSSADTVFNGALLSHKSGASAVRALTFEKQGSSTLELAGFIGKQTVSAASGAAAVNLIANGGVLNVTNAANTTTTNADAINIGTVTVTSGTLAFSSQALINTAGTAGASSILMNGGTLRWNSGTTQDLSAGASSRLTLVDGKTATFDTNGNDVSFANTLAGGAIAASVTKTGAGILTIGASNNYTGDTAVTTGTLLANNTSGSATGTGAVTVASGATLGGTGSVSGAVTVTGKIAPGSAGIGTLNAGSVTWKGASAAGSATNWEFALGSANTSDKLNITGDFTKDTSLGSVFNFDFLGSAFTGVFTLAQWTGSTTFSQSDFSYSNLGAASGTFTINGSTLEFTAVPEPTSALAGLLLGAGLLRRRRKVA